MLLGSMHTADLGVRHRELLHLASMDPDTTTILSCYVRDETVVGVVAGIAIAGAGGIMAAVQSSSRWWGLVPVAVGAVLSGGAWVRSRHWVTRVKRSLLSPGHVSTWSARFGRVPLRRYPHLPGLLAWSRRLSRFSANALFQALVGRTFRSSLEALPTADRRSGFSYSRFVHQ
jgi:hypothetical protein